jgi:hypothetical protein
MKRLTAAIWSRPSSARFRGRETELGTGVEGKLADLVQLDANPLQQIGNTKRIAAVVLNGRDLSRAVLDKLLECSLDDDG